MGGRATRQATGRLSEAGRRKAGPVGASVAAVKCQGVPARIHLPRRSTFTNGLEFRKTTRNDQIPTASRPPPGGCFPATVTVVNVR